MSARRWRVLAISLLLAGAAGAEPLPLREWSIAGFSADGRYAVFRWERANADCRESGLAVLRSEDGAEMVSVPVLREVRAGARCFGGRRVVGAAEGQRLRDRIEAVYGAIEPPRPLESLGDTASRPGLSVRLEARSRLPAIDCEPPAESEPGRAYLRFEIERDGRSSPIGRIVDVTPVVDPERPGCATWPPLTLGAAAADAAGRTLGVTAAGLPLALPLR